MPFLRLKKLYNFGSRYLQKCRRFILMGHTHRIGGVKSEQHFWLKSDCEKWSRTFYFEIPLAPSEIPANLPGQFSLSEQIFLHLAAATLKGLVQLQNKKF